ncbi:hypothetical protein BMS3Abin09_00340 [bacterium BMS3Abin09]|nr:hypothetical protein BMS3Abin09_00340 [bacterium BMS3Abin09]
MLTSKHGHGLAKPEYTKLQAARLIKQIAQKGSIRKTGHAKKRMKERNVSDQDILRVLNNGRIYNDPEPHIKTGNWIYTIIGSGIDDGNIVVPVFINKRENYILIVTLVREN